METEWIFLQWKQLRNWPIEWRQERERELGLRGAIVVEIDIALRLETSWSLLEQQPECLLNASAAPPADHSTTHLWSLNCALELGAFHLVSGPAGEK